MLTALIRDATAGRRPVAAMLGAQAVAHLLIFTALLLLAGRPEAGSTYLGIGLTAYALGARHAFDADHIAAIDNTTRTLVADGKRPTTVGLWFSLGHSTVVFAMACLVAVGSGIVGTLVTDDSAAHQTLGVIGASVSGVFLLLIGGINLMSYLSLRRTRRRLRDGDLDESDLGQLTLSGPLTRLLRPVLAAVDRPGRMYGVGLLFGLGFDTATETALLVLAGAGASHRMPWYAVLLLPALFAAGMSLFDSLDGILMQRAYRWAFIRPRRRLSYNMIVTGLSVAVAVIIGGVEVISVLHDKARLTDPVSSWIAGISLDRVGYLVVALFVAVWGTTLLRWQRQRRIESAG